MSRYRLPRRKLFECLVVTNYKQYLEHVAAFSFLAGSRAAVQEALAMQAYLAHISKLTTTRKAFCVTAEGKVWLAPPLTKTGDVLVHVKGGYVLILLR